MAKTSSAARPNRGGIALRRWREETGKTVIEAGVAFSVNPAHVSFLERGDRLPSLRLSILLREITGIDPGHWLENVAPAATATEAASASEIG